MAPGYPLHTVLNAATTHCQTSPLFPYLFLHQVTSPLASNLYSHLIRGTP